MVAVLSSNLTGEGSIGPADPHRARISWNRFTMPSYSLAARLERRRRAELGGPLSVLSHASHAFLGVTR
jgi:hypothetical protein